MVDTTYRMDPMAQSAMIKDEQRQLLSYQDMTAQSGSTDFQCSQPIQSALPYAHFAVMYINHRGELRTEASPSIAGYENTIFSEEVQQRFLRLANGEWQQGVLSNPPASSWYHPTLPRPTGLIPCEWQSLQSKRHRRGSRRVDSALGHAWEPPSPNPTLKRSTLRVGQTKLLRTYYEKAFHCFQQLNCRVISKAFIKFVEPRKQVNFPYNGKRGSKENDPEKTKPKWWPAGVRHREPDHLPKNERIRLLVHILCELRESHGVTAEKLRDAGQDVRRQMTPAIRLQILDEIFYVRGMEELYLDGKISGDTTIHVSHVHVEDQLGGLTISDNIHQPLSTISTTHRDQQAERRSYRDISIVTEDAYAHSQPLRNGKRRADFDFDQFMPPSPCSSISRKSSMERSTSAYSSDIDPAILAGPEPGRSPSMPQGSHPSGSTSLPDLFANQFAINSAGQSSQAGIWSTLAAPSMQAPYSFSAY
ncbi:DUF2841 domain-containing protein [Aspergillus stella-maris]|uniref:DUF2841 domain-containing protein n=1 Tax=Aspergillus stella-maris TaxID=1810926 RepID=UPI003CCCDF65